jgi:hypothetical protein
MRTVPAPAWVRPVAQSADVGFAGASADLAEDQDRDLLDAYDAAVGNGSGHTVQADDPAEEFAA